MAGTPVKGARRDGPKSEVRRLVEEHNKVVADLEALRRTVNDRYRNRVIPIAATGAGFTIDATAEDVETDNTVILQINGRQGAVAAVSALDISAAGSGAGDTVAQDLIGTAWAFLTEAGGLDVETAAAAYGQATAIDALAQWANATGGRLPIANSAPIGFVQVAPTSGTHTLGTTALTTVGTFSDLLGLSYVITPAASFAVHSTPAEIVYGAGVGRLGTGTRVAYTGKAGVAIKAGTVAHGKTGAWLIYVLADDSETTLQFGVAHGTLAEARAAVEAHSRNPQLIWIGTLYVTNNTGSNWVGATDSLSEPNLVVTFDTVPAPYAGVDAAADLTAATVNA